MSQRTSGRLSARESARESARISDIRATHDVDDTSSNHESLDAMNVVSSPPPRASYRGSRERRSGTTERIGSRLSSNSSLGLQRPSVVSHDASGPFPVANGKDEDDEERTSLPPPLADAPLVFDLGSGFGKVGFAGEDAPRGMFPSVVGAPRFGNKIALIGTREANYVGNNANSRRGILHMRYPVKHGMIRDWDGMEELWEYTFEEVLNAEASAQGLLMSDPPLNPKKNRQKTATIMFEKFGVPSLFFEQTAVLSLYAVGRTTGLVCDVGQGLAHVIPVWDGWCLPYAIQRLNLGGRDLTEYLMKLLMEDGCELVSTSNREIARDIKEKLCFCALDWESEFEKSIEDEESFVSEYTLPDGQTITVGSAKFRVCEPLFRPWQLGVESRGIHELVMQAVHKSDLDLHRGLMESIVLSGGSSLFEGLPTRFQREMDIVASDWDIDPKVIAPHERQISPWIGGSILASLHTFQQMWIHRHEYDEVGSSIVIRRGM